MASGVERRVSRLKASDASSKSKGIGRSVDKKLALSSTTTARCSWRWRRVKEEGKEGVSGKRWLAGEEELKSRRHVIGS